MFYPSYGYRSDAETWSVVIQGCVYNQRITWLRRKPVLAVIRRAMKVSRDGDVYFRQRMRQFLVSFSSGRHVNIELGTKSITLGPTELAGLFRGELAISDVEARSLENEAERQSPDAGASDPNSRQRWISFRAQLPEHDPRPFSGCVQLLEPQGISIISDVDDTLKHSNVPDRRDLFHNTFVRDFVPIPGMPELYREWAERGAAFHYVSGSPWQLYEPLAEFWKEQGYPRGSFHLKRFRLRETARKLRGMSPQRVHKQAAIEPIVAAFPHRKFVLIGDSGEQDPEIYAHFLRNHSSQIALVLIRAVRGLEVDLPRLRKTFAGVSDQLWMAYESADELRARLQPMMNLIVGDPCQPQG